MIAHYLLKMWGESGEWKMKVPNVSIDPQVSANFIHLGMKYIANDIICEAIIT